MRSTTIALLALFICFNCGVFGEPQKPVLPPDVERAEDGTFQTRCLESVTVTITTANNLNVDLNPWRVLVPINCGIQWNITVNGVAVPGRIKLDHPGHFVGGNPDFEVNPKTGPIRDTAPIHTAFGYSIEVEAEVTVKEGVTAIATVVVDPEYERDR